MRGDRGGPGGAGHRRRSAAHDGGHLTGGRALFVHLIEPGDWRAALTAGAVRPPSLAGVGFVHLSTPEQVHLPARALYPGRRDLVLLVVDPARLTDPVRIEEGVPADPAGRRFPHLYGPLPTRAVVAVVPYRPPVPPSLPAPDDVLGRALALYASLPVRRAVGVGDVPGGVAVLDPDFAHSRDNNRLVLTSPVDAATIEAAAAEVAGNAGWPHQAAALLWPGAADVAAELARRGWETEELLADGPRGRPAARGRAGAGGRRARGPRPLGPVVAARPPRGRPAAGPDRGPADRPGAPQRPGPRRAPTWWSGRAADVVAAAQLRVDGATAAVESVMTDPAARGRGHGDAVLARALALAAEAGCDLVVLEAAADDWPRHWYARRGFEAVGTSWFVGRPREP